MFVTPKTERDEEVKTFRRPDYPTLNNYIVRFNGSSNYIDNIRTLAGFNLELY